MSIWTSSLDSFSDAIAADTPVPSCGAMACVCAHFSLALLLMALRKSAGCDLEQERQTTISEIEHLLPVIKAHADNDVRTFSAFIDESQATDQGHSEQRTLEITLGALAAARSCLQGIDLAQRGLACVKAFLQSDAVAAALTLHASLSALLLNMDSDLDQLEPSERKIDLERSRAELQHRADQALGRIRRH